MKTRVISASVLIAISVLCVALSPWTRVLFFAVSGLLCAYEYSRGMEKIDVYCCAWVMYVYLFAQAVLAVLHAGAVAFIVCFSAAVFLALFSGILYKKVSGIGALYTLAGVAYPCFLMSLLMVISVSGIWMETLILGAISSWVCDAFALIGGMRFGKHKLAPDVSPKKTVEGCLCGAVSSAAAGALLSFLFPVFGIEGLSPAVCILTALTASTVGQIGDLAESLVKRTLGIKDFSKLIPGHGGMFDRADSLLFSIPAAYLCLYIAALV